MPGLTHSLSFNFRNYTPLSLSNSYVTLKFSRMQSPHQRKSLELLWPRVVLRKLLNIPSKHSDFGADSDIEDDDDARTFYDAEEGERDNLDYLPRIRRRKSETFRAQYINTKEIRVCAGTWNVAGELPPDDLEIEEWLNINDPSDIYVLGLQEIIPLNAGNIFGAEDNRPVLKWESIIRETLSRIQPPRNTYKSYSDPPSPSKFEPSDDVLDFEDEILLETDSDDDEVVHPIDGDRMFNFDNLWKSKENSNGSAKSPEFDKYGQKDTNKEISSAKSTNLKLSKALSGTEKIGLSWPEPPLNLVAQRVLERPYILKSTKSLKASKSFQIYNSLKIIGDRRAVSDASALAKLDLDTLVQWRRRKPEYVRIVSKQMVGIFLTIWVRKSLRKHIQNLKVSTVGVGAMGYIGNKGAVSVSMSIYQTLFCFICTHLTSGEKEIDQLKRNADVLEIHRRTLFRSGSGLGVPQSIKDHERIIWLGDLNYRINLPYEETRRLISRKEWATLVEYDQLITELRKGRVFDGWCEGVLSFPPTYKYEMDSDTYVGEDPSKAGRRTPAWCDRILSFGKGIKLRNYRRSELKFSDHRPVTAVYNIEVEVFSSKKLQRALTLTNAEIVNEDILIDPRMNAAVTR